MLHHPLSDILIFYVNHEQIQKLLRNEIVFYNWCGYSFKDKLKEYALKLFVIPSIVITIISIIYHFIYYLINNTIKGQVYQYYAYGYENKLVFIIISVILIIFIYNLSMVFLLLKTKKNEGV